MAGSPPAPGRRSGIDRDILLTGAGCVLILFAGLLIAGVFALRAVDGACRGGCPDGDGYTRADSDTHADNGLPYLPLPTWTPMGVKPQAHDYRGHDAEYRVDVNNLGDFLKESISDINAMLQNPQPTNQNWQYKVVTQTNVWQESFSDTTATIPPGQYQGFQENLLKALSHLKTADDDVDYALEFNEPDRLDQARSEIATGSKLLDAVIASLHSSV